MSILENALAEAKLLKQASLVRAKQELLEAMTPTIISKINAQLQEEVDSEEDDNSNKDELLFDDEDVVEESEDPTESDDEEIEFDEESDEDVVEESDDSMEDEEEPMLDDEDDALLKELDDELSDESYEEADDEIIPIDDITEPEEDVESTEDDELLESLDNLLTQLKESDDMEEEEEEDKTAELKAENISLKRKLKESYNTINVLRTQINEVNILNTKLAFISKLFKKNSLSESQKNKIIDQFDRAKNVREVKLVYTTLVESLKQKANIKQLAESLHKNVKGTQRGNAEDSSELAQIKKRNKEIIDYKFRH